MVKNKRRIAVLALVLAAPFIHCTLSEPLSQDHYAGTGKIGGGNPPSVPVVTFTAAQLRFDFSASIDPESGSEVGTYLIYAYDGDPSTYYQPRDVVRTITPPAVRSFYYTGLQTGVRTAIVTGYDGYRESAVTAQNKIVFSFP
jgi:hypothetical protein